MRVIFYILIAITLFSCKKAEEKAAVQKEVKLPKMQETFPFSESSKVELISYHFMDYRHSENAFNYELRDGKLPFDESIIKERLILDKKQLEELYTILNTENCHENFSKDCYMPEHRITFYDKNNKVIAFLEVCLQCIGSRISEGFKTVKLCDAKMKELEQFFRSVGIRHFSKM